MRLYLPAFYLGVAEELEKSASTDMGSMPLNENILPNIGKQTKWKYVRTKDGLKLTDGNLVYSFGGFPEEFPAEDTRVSRLSDDNILNLENEALSKGTAQIHRASPDNIYMTLADGRQNPTFMLQHEAGQNWRYSPSKKFLQKLKALSEANKPAAPTEESLHVDPQALIDGGVEAVKAAFMSLDMDAGDAASAIQTAGSAIGDFASNRAQEALQHPISSMLGGYALTKGIGRARDLISPEREELRKASPKERTSRELAPIVSAVVPTIALSALAQR